MLLRKPVPTKMKIGYPCINLSLPCRSSSRFRLATYSEEKIKETIEGNLECLSRILEFNAKHELLFFRISSDLIPFASHPVCTFPWQHVFEKEFRRMGDFIKHHHLRISMHPDQFVLINSLNHNIFERSAKELWYHAEILDLLGADTTAKIQIHVGGVYGDKNGSIRRFVSRYNELPERVRRRLVIENDERLYSVRDCLSIHEKTHIPVVFDAFHFRCNPEGEGIRETFLKLCSTWSDRDGLPIIDYSTQEPMKRMGTHAQSIHLRDFRAFLEETKGFDFDIMCEIKDKEKSALKARRVLKQMKLI